MMFPRLIPADSVLNIGSKSFATSSGEPPQSLSGVAQALLFQLQWRSTAMVPAERGLRSRRLSSSFKYLLMPHAQCWMRCAPAPRRFGGTLPWLRLPWLHLEEGFVLPIRTASGQTSEEMGNCGAAHPISERRPAEIAAQARLGSETYAIRARPSCGHSPCRRQIKDLRERLDLLLWQAVKACLDLTHPLQPPPAYGSTDLRFQGQRISKHLKIKMFRKQQRIGVADWAETSGTKVPRSFAEGLQWQWMGLVTFLRRVSVLGKGAAAGLMTAGAPAAA